MTAGCAYYEVIGVCMSLYTVGLLQHSIWPSNRNRVHVLKVTLAALSQKQHMLAVSANESQACWLTLHGGRTSGGDVM